MADPNPKNIAKTRIPPIENCPMMNRNIDSADIIMMVVTTTPALSNLPTESGMA